MAAYEYEDERSGWLTFAAILMFAVAFVRIVSAIRYASASDALGDISQAADTLASTTKSTLTGPDCSSS
jgi:hypothetical protein